jgi:hypothetical protein
LKLSLKIGMVALLGVMLISVTPGFVSFAAITNTPATSCPITGKDKFWMTPKSIYYYNAYNSTNDRLSMIYCTTITDVGSVHVTITVPNGTVAYSFTSDTVFSGNLTLTGSTLSVPGVWTFAATWNYGNNLSKEISHTVDVKPPK